MFEKMRERMVSFLLPSGMNVYSGTDEAFNDQIIQPLIYGQPKNKFQNSDTEKVATCVTCIKVLGDTISRLPINVYQATSDGNQIDKEDYRYDMLHYSPNGMISSNVFFGALEYQRNLKGNSFARITRDTFTGQVKSLEFIPTNMVSGYKIVRGKLFYIVYKKNSKGETVDADNILHFRMITKNSIWGINPIESQRLNLSTLWKAKNTVDSFYENNAFSPKVLKSLIPDAQFQKQFAEAMIQFKTQNVGPANAGEIIKLPPFTEIQELTLDPVDAKFIESSKFDTTQIAAFYGVPPEMVGVYEYSKYNNVEQSQLNFKVNTISAIARMYRQELEMKLLTTDERKNGKSIEFVTQALIETDIATRSAYYKTMQDLGVMTPNQIALLEGLPTFDGGDKHYMSSQTTALEDRDVREDEPIDQEETQDASIA